MLLSGPSLKQMKCQLLLLKLSI